MFSGVPPFKETPIKNSLTFPQEAILEREHQKLPSPSAQEGRCPGMITAQELFEGRFLRCFVEGVQVCGKIGSEDHLVHDLAKSMTSSFSDVLRRPKIMTSKFKQLGFVVYFSSSSVVTCQLLFPQICHLAAAIPYQHLQVDAGGGGSWLSISRQGPRRFHL